MIYLKKKLFKKKKELITYFNSDNPFYGYNYLKGGLGACGYKHSDNSKHKMKILKQGKRHPRAKSIYQLHPETLSIVKEYNTITEAVSTMFKSNSCIVQACKKCGGLVYGWKWCYKNDYEKIKKD